MQEPKLGDTVNLFCNDTDGPQTVIGWVADGIDVGSRQGLDINGNTLTISSFSAEYEAIYQCIAQENNGELRQLSPPILVSAFGKTLNLVSMHCSPHVQCLVSNKPV